MTRFAAGNAVQLLKSGPEFFPALEAAINAAVAEIHLQTYIFQHDAVGRRVEAALVRAARRGVAVRVLVDGFGSDAFQQSAARAAMEKAGVRVLVFRPTLGWADFRRHRLRRMHRKLAVIDGRLAFIGGINIQDDYDNPRSPDGRLDYAVCVQGPLLAEIHSAACSLWGRVSWSQFKRRWRPAEPIEPIIAPRGDVAAALLLRDNFKYRSAIEEVYLEAIAAAQTEVIIANAYFFPSRSFRDALAMAAARGVRVVLLLQGRMEYWLHHYASRALYADLLRAGVEIHEYQRSHLHAKVAVIDGSWLTVGSSNIDPFSLLLAKEANVVMQEARSGQALRQSLHEEMARGATRVARERWEALPWLDRLYCRLALGLARLALTFSVSGSDRRFD